MIATTVSFCISLVGAGLLLSGKVPEGTVTSAGPKGSEAVISHHVKLEDLSGKGLQNNLLHLE